MRLETTYKHKPLPNDHSFYFQFMRFNCDTTFHKRRQRRASRHQVNLDTKKEVSEYLSFVEDEIKEFCLQMEFDHGDNDYEMYKDEIDWEQEEIDYEERANKWELENDEYLFQNRLGIYEGWEGYDSGSHYDV